MATAKLLLVLLAFALSAASVQAAEPVPAEVTVTVQREPGAAAAAAAEATVASGEWAEMRAGDPAAKEQPMDRPTGADGGPERYRPPAASQGEPR